VIVDCHTHIFPPFFSKERERFFDDEPAFEMIYGNPGSKMATREELIRSMDEEGVDKSVVFGFPWRKERHFQRHNDYILESVAQYSDRLIGLCCFSMEASSVAGEVDRCLRAGLAGMGEIAIYQSGFTRDKADRFKDIMALGEHFNVPLLLHTNEPVGHQYPGKAPMTLGQIYDFLKTYPSNRVILAHWGGGIFFYSLMKREVGDVFRNVWFDTAASPFLYKPDIYRLAGEIIGFDRILFGSDYPLIKPGRYVDEIKSSGLSTEAIDRVLGGNAIQLFEKAHEQNQGSQN
jgi:predicted TIM-barrel fold metal-dependent hydrolase